MTTNVIIFALYTSIFMAVIICQAVKKIKTEEENRTLKLDNAKLTIQVERRDVHIARLREMKNLPPLKEGELDVAN